VYSKYLVTYTVLVRGQSKQLFQKPQADEFHYHPFCRSDEFIAQNEDEVCKLAEKSIQSYCERKRRLFEKNEFKRFECRKYFDSKWSNRFLSIDSMEGYIEEVIHCYKYSEQPLETSIKELTAEQFKNEYGHLVMNGRR
jgi:predicted amidophosphoribosyltransferase